MYQNKSTPKKRRFRLQANVQPSWHQVQSTQTIGKVFRPLVGQLLALTGRPVQLLALAIARSKNPRRTPCSLGALILYRMDSLAEAGNAWLEARPPRQYWLERGIEGIPWVAVRVNLHPAYSASVVAAVSIVVIVDDVRAAIRAVSPRGCVPGATDRLLGDVAALAVVEPVEGAHGGR